MTIKRLMIDQPTTVCNEEKFCFEISKISMKSLQKVKLKTKLNFNINILNLIEYFVYSFESFDDSTLINDD